jgi:hypothetical protein
MNDLRRVHKLVTLIGAGILLALGVYVVLTEVIIRKGTEFADLPKTTINLIRYVFYVFSVMTFMGIRFVARKLRKGNKPLPAQGMVKFSPRGQRFFLSGVLLY